MVVGCSSVAGGHKPTLGLVLFITTKALIDGGLHKGLQKLLHSGDTADIHSLAPNERAIESIIVRLSNRKHVLSNYNR